MNDISFIFNDHPMVSNMRDIMDICAPLATLDITTFSHIRTFPNNRFSVLCNNIDFVCNYFKKNYHHADPCVQLKPDVCDLGQLIVWDIIECQGKTAKMMKDAADFNFRHVFTIIKHTKDFIDYYHFGTHLTNSSINQHYLNNLDLLDKFIHYYQGAVKNSCSLSKIYYHEQQFESVSSENDWSMFKGAALGQRKQFLNKIGLQSELKLTIRELEYGQLLLKGKTAKEIAISLKQSPRTVESRLDILKSKLYAKNKIDLVLKLKEIL